MKVAVRRLAMRSDVDLREIVEISWLKRLAERHVTPSSPTNQHAGSRRTIFMSISFLCPGNLKSRFAAAVRAAAKLHRPLHSQGKQNVRVSMSMNGG